MFPFPPFPFSFSHSAELNQVVATVLQSVITAPQGENYKRKEHQTTSTDHLISGRSQRKIYCKKVTFTSTYISHFLLVNNCS